MINIVDFEIDKQLNYLKSILMANKYREVVFFCVGNYKIWYDSFAPELAENLRNCRNFNYFIYGGKTYSILPDNLIEYMDFIEKKHPGALIIVVDNCLSVDGRNQFVVNNTSCAPAGFLNFKKFGDVSMLMKCNYSHNCHEYLKLQNKVIIKIIRFFDNIA